MFLIFKKSFRLPGVHPVKVDIESFRCGVSQFERLVGIVFSYISPFSDPVVGFDERVIDGDDARYVRCTDGDPYGRLGVDIATVY
jgi:hypothetical protein